MHVYGGHGGGGDVEKKVLTRCNQHGTAQCRSQCGITVIHAGPTRITVKRGRLFNRTGQVCECELYNPSSPGLAV